MQNAKYFYFAWLIVSALFTQTVYAQEPTEHGIEVVEQQPAPSNDTTVVEIESTHGQQMDILRTNTRIQRLQTAGYVFLGVGLGAAIFGASAVEIDAWGGFGKAGFITVGAGIANAVVGMFILGLSNPAYPIKRKRRLAAALSPQKNGFALSSTLVF